MKSTLENTIRLQVARVLSRLFGSRIGVITSYDPNRHAVKVTYQPDGIQSGWMPLASAWVGNNWGLFAAPVLGQTIKVNFLEWALDAPIAELRLYNTANQPLAVPAGEFWLVHKAGSFLKFTNDGKVTVTDGQGAQVQFDGAGNIVSQANQWTHTGPVAINGNVTVTGDTTVSGTVTGQTEVIAKTGGSAVHLSTHTTPTAPPGSLSPPTPGS